jgi:cell division septum initiation protein DivIVA
VNSPADDLDPSRLESASFELVRRGFDPTAVRDELQRAAQEIRRVRLERDELAGRLAEFDGISPDHLEAHQVAEALGAEATQVIEAAHLAARERAERAEREADAVRDESIATADTTRAEASAAREQMLEEARREAEELVEDGRGRGRDMVAEAQTVRERMLRDLARKRQTGRAQVEQLRAGRDRLLESLTIAQEGLDTSVTDLVNSVPEARSAAERAGLRVTSEPTPSPEQLEGEIESARLVGHPLIDDVVDPGPVEDTFTTGEMEALTHLDVLDGGTLDSDVPVLDSPALDDTNDEAEAEADNDAGESDAEDAVALYDVDAEDSESDEEEAEADDVFAKLRSAQEPSGEDESDPAADPEPAADPDPDPDPDPEPEPESGGLDVGRAGARKRAADAAAKAMKKVLVEEQGTLLDGVRRSGAEALSFVTDDANAHRVTYEKAAAAALKELASELGGSKRMRLGAAYAQIDAIALEPVRQRLSDVAERVDDADELSDTVRALYRESRSRRLDEAAAAAVVAVDGLVAIANAGGPVVWRVEDGGPCGPDCADNSLAGEIKAGDEFPTGDAHPPSHPACTCWLDAITG